MQNDGFIDCWFVLAHRTPPRELAVLLCNKSNAFYSLGKWDEAFLAAKECLQWDPTYVKVWGWLLPSSPPTLVAFFLLVKVFILEMLLECTCSSDTCPWAGGAFPGEELGTGLVSVETCPWRGWSLTAWYLELSERLEELI